MHILLITSHLYRRAGAETYTLGLGDMLKQQGHKVSYFSMHHPHNIECAQSRFFVDYIDFAELNEQKTLRNGLWVLSRSIYSTQARSRIKELIDELKPDVAHLSNIHGHITPSILFELKRQRIPVVWTLHDFRQLCPDIHLMHKGKICEDCKGGRFYNCVVKRCKKSSLSASFVAAMEAYVHKALRVRDKADLFIAPSNLLRDKYIEHGFPEEKIVFIRNFLPDPPQVDESAGEPSEHALFLGQLTEQKGIRTLLRAAELCPDIPIKVAGRGPLDSEIKAIVVDRNLSNVSLVGHLSGEEVMRELRAASFLVFPSMSYENCPYSIMEAQSLRKPVIASRLGGPMEQIEHGRTGMLFEPGNAEELAAAMRELWDDREKRQLLGNNAAVFAKTEYDLEPYLVKISEIYRRLLPEVTPLG